MFDVVVIGAGIVGAAIARELSASALSVGIVEARDDIGDGTSKANTAILHTGFDATPGTLESRLVHRGHRLLSDYAAETGIPIEHTGALVVAWNEEERAALPALKEKAIRNGYHRCEVVDSAEVYRQLPSLGQGAVGGLIVPDESIVCTWSTNLALATDAKQRGATLLLNHNITSVDTDVDVTTLTSHRGTVRGRWVINAAGLGADIIDRLFGFDRFAVTPRRGELLVYDKLARPLVDKIVLPVPTARGKGVLISPTIYGNVMLGPTSENLTDRSDTATSEAGFEFLLAKGRALMPRLLDEEVTASYAGLRAAIDHGDYLIEIDPRVRYVLVGGIRSTGLTAGMAIAEYVRDMLIDAAVTLTPRVSLPAAPRMPNLGEGYLRPFEDVQRIEADDGYGRVVCFCERVTEGELRDAYLSPIPPAGLEGLRRRTRVMNGRCQGFFCGARVGDLVARGGTCSPRSPSRSGNAMPVEPAVLTPDVVIVGAGPAGLTAAATLAGRVTGQVLVLDREGTAGGIPRHSDHPGYGIRDLKRFMSGPSYARLLVDRAARAGACIRTESMVTDWAGDQSLNVTSPQGRFRVDAKAVVLATGARERPRSARLIPGDRPRGVFTTGHLQNLVHLYHGSLGPRAVVVGAELVSWSAVLTLRHAGCRTVLMTTEFASPESYAVFTLAGKALLRTPIATHTRVTRIIGHGHLEAVEIEDGKTGERKTVACDVVVFTGDWIPDHELARSGDIQLDCGSLGPLVDTALRTSRPGVFAAGNLLHPVDTADIAALDGRHVANQIVRWLEGTGPDTACVRILPTGPIRWVSPGLLRTGDPTPPRGRLLLWTKELVRIPHITVHQDGQEIVHRRLPWAASPGRMFRVPSSLLKDVDHAGGDVKIGLRPT